MADVIKNASIMATSHDLHKSIRHESKQETSWEGRGLWACAGDKGVMRDEYVYSILHTRMYFSKVKKKIFKEEKKENEIHQLPGLFKHPRDSDVSEAVTGQAGITKDTKK